MGLTPYFEWTGLQILVGYGNGLINMYKNRSVRPGLLSIHLAKMIIYTTTLHPVFINKEIGYAGRSVSCGGTSRQ